MFFVKIYSINPFMKRLKSKWNIKINSERIMCYEAITERVGKGCVICILRT